MRARFTWGLVCLLLVVAACGGEDGPGPDAGSGGTGGTAGTGGDACVDCEVCTSATDCDDGLFCNGTEACDPDSEDANSNGCVIGTAPSCDDGIECTVDDCDEESNGCNSSAPDVDQDGHNDATCVDQDGEPLGDDCDDNDANRFPGNAELCDALDQDCDPLTIGSKDDDGDGSIDDACCNTNDDGEERCGGDCNDDSIAQRTGQPEFCDNIDNDCDGVIDNNTVEVLWYVDADRDGFGDVNDLTPTPSCDPILAASLINNDCDDTDITVHPAQAETCDGMDNNCNELVDEALLSCATTDPTDPVPPVNECINGFDDCNRSTHRCEDRRVGFVCVPVSTSTPSCSVNNGGCGSPALYECDDSRPNLPLTCLDVNECDDGNNGGCGSQACINLPGAAPVCVTEVPCTGDFVVTNQSELNALVALGCTRITGSISIHGSTLTSLAGLETIRRIDGHLEVVANPSLASVAGLSNLLRVGRHVAFNENPVLSAITLSSLRAVGGFFDIMNNASLTTLQGLNALVRSEGGFSLWNNHALTSTAAMTNLQYAGGSDGFSITGSLSLSTLSFPALREVSHFEIVDNSSLASLGNLSALRTITGNLWIYQSGVLTNVSALGGVTYVGGDASIQYVPSLRNLNGINVEHVGGDLVIDDNDGLTGLSGFSNLTTVGGDVVIANNLGLVGVSGFARLADVGGSLRFAYNDNLANVVGFPLLTSVHADLSVTDNERLAHIDGLGSLQSLYGSVVIRGNPALTEVSAIGQLASIGGDLRLEANATLNTLEALRTGALRTVTNRLMIRINPQLSVCEVTALRARLTAHDWTQDDLSAANRGCTTCNGALCVAGAGGTAGQSTIFAGSDAAGENDFAWSLTTSLSLLSNVTAITGDLTIAYTPLTDLSALSNLTAVGGSLTLYSNPLLANISPLYSLAELGGDFVVYENSSLSECAPIAVVDNLPGGLSGTFTNDANETCSGTCNAGVCQ